MFTAAQATNLARNKSAVLENANPVFEAIKQAASEGRSNVEYTFKDINNHLMIEIIKYLSSIGYYVSKILLHTITIYWSV